MMIYLVDEKNLNLNKAHRHDDETRKGVHTEKEDSSEDDAKPISVACSSQRGQLFH